MAYLAQSLVMKNGETCDKDGDICASEVSITDSDDSGSIAAQRTEKHIPDGCCSNSSQVTDGFPCNSQKTEMNSLLGSYITKEYELLHLVLSHLPLRDLNAASKVCRTWYSAAISVRRSRTHPHWLLWHNSIHQKIPKQLCRMKHAKFPEAEFPRFAFHEYVYSEPSLALMFASQTVYIEQILCTSKSSCPAVDAGSNCEEDGHRHRVWDYIRAELQPSCPLVCLRGYGTIGTLPDLSETVELEIGRSYSVLLLPNMPGVSFHTFQLDENQVTRLQNCDPRDLNPDVIEEMTRIPTGESVQCLLLFCRETTCAVPAIEHLVALLQNRQEETMAVAGGLINDVGGVRRHCPVIVGVAFLGEGMCVASTVLGQDVATERDADRAVQELKAHTVSSYSNSIGLMFACVGRGRHHYQGKRNVESAAFRRHFPRTPLLGYFGNGEIGFKLLPDVKGNKKLADGPTRGSKKKRTDIPIIVHSYTTIMVHIAFTGGKTSNLSYR
jgi:F-box protein 22